MTWIVSSLKRSKLLTNLELDWLRKIETTQISNIKIKQDITTGFIE